MSGVERKDGEQRVDEPRTGATGGSGGDRPPGKIGGGPPHEAPDDNVRMREEALETSPETRDTTPALGSFGGPASWQRAVDGAEIDLARSSWGDARWSYLYGSDTAYSKRGEANGRVAEAARAMRGGEDLPEIVQGPMMKAAVWTWEVPAYFWLGGITSGSSFIALACDLAGDHRAAAVARKVAFAAVVPCSPLLILDLGRPGRFLNMLRIFKPRSPMSMGAWCLVAYTNASTFAVSADVLARPRLARGFGAGAAALGTYLGSYTGVLLAATAVPVWARSRLFLGPIFVSTAMATSAATNRLLLSALGRRPGDPTRAALGAIETGAMAAELVLSHYNEKRLGRLGHALEDGTPGKLFKGAKIAVQAGLALRLIGRRRGTVPEHLTSALFLGAGLAFRYAWVGAGRSSAADDLGVAAAARTKARTLGKERVRNWRVKRRRQG
jgi:hypothetical protein